MEGRDIFVKLRDTADEVVKAIDSRDEKQCDAALVQFLCLMMQLDALTK